jgi:MFS family permease
MNAAEDTLTPRHSGWASRLWHRQLYRYPDTGVRVVFLAITVLATVTLYYELYVGGSVSTLLLANLHMSFTFYVVILAFGNLVGAFGSLLAGLADRLGRANMVVFGLLFTGIFTAFVLPYATGKWTFGIETFVVALVEGMCLVATPALIRDFSPQVGRATAMGFWIAGPMLGSLIVAVVGSHTIPTVVADPRFWTHEYRICGITGLVVFVIALIGLRELSPQLHDQLMVTMRDRALIEARAKNIAAAHQRTGRGVEVDGCGGLVGPDGRSMGLISAVGSPREGDEIVRYGRMGAFTFNLAAIKNHSVEVAATVLCRLETCYGEAAVTLAGSLTPELAEAVSLDVRRMTARRRDHREEFIARLEDNLQTILDRTIRSGGGPLTDRALRTAVTTAAAAKLRDISVTPRDLRSNLGLELDSTRGVVQPTG